MVIKQIQITQSTSFKFQKDILKIKVSKLIHYLGELEKNVFFYEKAFCMLIAYVIKIFLLKILVNKRKG